MAGGVGNTYACAALDALMGSGSPATWYAALMTTTPSDVGGGVELAIGTDGYDRVPLTNNATNFPAASVEGGVATQDNGVDIVWGPCSSANWAAVVAVALYDAATGGNLGPWAPLSAPVTVNVGQSFKVPAGSGVFTAG